MLRQARFCGRRKAKRTNITENIFGAVSKNTNSGLIGGVAGKYSRKIGDGKFQSFGLEIVNVKNP